MLGYLILFSAKIGMQWYLVLRIRYHCYMMKLFTVYLLGVLLLMNLVANCQEEQKDYKQTILNERIEKFNHLKSRKHSPLQKQDRKRLKQLTYFDADLDYKVLAAYLPIVRPDTVSFLTSSGKEKLFECFARFEFTLLGHSDTLFAYKRIWPEGYADNNTPTLFIPFTDFTNGIASYGGGRYMDVEIPVPGVRTSILDFNLCYNPYCAYGEGFSCPIPPKENALSIEVKAGERHVKEH
jgi:uncharacterized protein (DUF1684 family)